MFFIQFLRTHEILFCIYKFFIRITLYKFKAIGFCILINLQQEARNTFIPVFRYDCKTQKGLCLNKKSLYDKMKHKKKLSEDGRFVGRKIHV